MAGAFAAAALALGVSVVAGSPASAAGSGDACPAGRVCLYFNSNGGGARADLARSDGALNNELFTDGPAGRNGWGVVVGNNAASVRNRTSDVIVVYAGQGCTGNWSRIPAGGQVYNLADGYWNMQNRVSSIWIYGTNNDSCVNIDQSWA